MIAQIKGKLVEKSSTEIVVDCSGVGYLLFISVQTFDSLPKLGSEVILKTIYIQREDSVSLYGFLDKVEREAFKMLISISGIGPKSAIGILSAISAAELRALVVSGNLPAMVKLPGIGKKTAERLILELKDKILMLPSSGEDGTTLANAMVKQEAMAALTTLGYSKAIAEKAIKSAVDELKGSELTAENLIKIALKFALK